MPNTDPTLPFRGTADPGSQEFDAWPQQTLLQSLEEGRIDWPSSCRTGQCRTCMAQLTQGQATHTVDWPGLSAEELAQGCVLPCVARPLSDVHLVYAGFC